MKKEEYIRRVLLRMNEASQAGIISIIGADTSKAKTFVEATFAEAFRKLAYHFPAHYFFQKKLENPQQNEEELGVGTIRCPEDFLKFVSLKMRGWRTAVYFAQTENDDVMRKQSNEYTRGSCERPVVVIRRGGGNNNSGYEILYYSLPKWYETHEILFGYYIPTLDLPAGDGSEIEYVNFDDWQLRDSLEWINAGKVFDIFGKPDFAELCNKNAINN